MMYFIFNKFDYFIFNFLFHKNKRKKEQKETRKGLTPELIAQIEEEVLGITPNDRTSEEN